MIRLLSLVLLLPCFANLISQDERWSPAHVYYGSGGALSYTADEQGNVIPDVPVVVEVSPVDGDDGASIQAAIDQVEAMDADMNGFRGAVLLKAGTYEVEGTLSIQSSGVVLWGGGTDRRRNHYNSGRNRSGEPD